MEHSTCSAWTMYLDGHITPDGTNMPLPIATASQFNLYYNYQLQQPPNSTFTTTTYMAVCLLSRKPPTVPPSLYVSFTNNLIIYFTSIDIHILLSTIVRYNHCHSLRVMLLAFPEFLFSSSLFKGFLSFFSHCYIFISVWFLV